MRHSVLPVGIVLTALGLGLSGCSNTSPEPAAPTAATQAPGAPGDSNPTEEDRIKAEFAKMSPEDAAAAELQSICPVSGEKLGTMGVPEKVDVNGQPVWICCEGCKDPLLASPAEHLAKLKKGE
jgi:Cu(I)/Ag(I) efflux system membrane fusion protein